MTSMRSVVLRWYGSLLAGVVPLSGAGFAVSALANRLAFAGWGLGMAVLYAALLRHGWQAGRGPRRLAGTALVVFALSTLTYGALAARYREALDLGLRAFSPALDPALLAAPLPALVAAGLLLAAGGLCFVRAPARRKEELSPTEVPKT